MADSKIRAERPLSPHLQIYRPMLTMVLSIVHRITGAALYLGTILLAAWLISAATGRSGFEQTQWLFGSWIGRLVLLVYTWALLHHMLGGIKHLAWDMGYGFGAEAREATAKLTLAGSVGLTLVVWVVAYLVR